MDWIEEKQGDFYTQRYKVERCLFSEQSPFQKVEVVESYKYGRMLFNDSLAMISEWDEHVYHEMMAHVPLFVHPRPERVLIIGGGDGGTAREVVRHPSVVECTVVEIDEVVVRASKEYLPFCAKSFSHPRVNLVIADGVDFVANHEANAFDVVLVDSTDPIGPATPLFGQDFYRNLQRCLKPEGIVVSQGESHWLELEMQKKLLEIKHSLFSIVACYNYNNLIYPGGAWSFTWGSEKHHPLEGRQGRGREKLDCRYYNTRVHEAAFALPTEQWKDIGKFCKGMV